MRFNTLILMSLLVVGCKESSAANYQGKYLAGIGNKCLAEKSANSNNFLMKITKLEDGTYNALMPHFTNRFRLQEQSGAADFEQESLTFVFSSRKSKARSAKMIITVSPSPLDDKNLIITRWSVASSFSGLNSKVNILESMFEKKPNNMFRSEKVSGLCVKKIM